MSDESRFQAQALPRIALLLCLRFLLFSPPCLVAWLLMLPGYTLVVAHTAALLLGGVFGETVTGVDILPAGILNTDTAMRYVLGERSATMAGVGHLVANVAPFVALILATPGTVRRRARAIAVGVPILFAFHVATIVLRFEAGRTTLPTVTGFVAVTLPFLLWIILLFWKSVSSPVMDCSSHE